ncbi:MAG: sel1 repeat family protein [Pseudomonadota bacterium]|nr:sel1 repeat family protein [Pseudomonadota bacterium]
MQKDELAAVKWSRRAAELEFRSAQYHMAFLYGNGLGVPKDTVELVNWLRKAAKQGHADARKTLNTLYVNNVVVYDSRSYENYFRDIFERECPGARTYLERAANEEHPRILMATHLLHAVDYFAKCKANPSEFFAMMMKDPNFFGECIYKYVFTKFLEQLKAEQQIELSSRYFYKGSLPDMPAKRIIAALEKIEKVDDPELMSKLWDMLHHLTAKLESENSEKVEKYRAMHKFTLFPQHMEEQMVAPESLPKKAKKEISGEAAHYFEEKAYENSRLGL